MGIFSGPEKKDKLMLAFHVGSSSVEGVLFRARPSVVPEIVFSAQETIQTEKEINIQKLLSSTVQALEKVAEKIHRAGLGAPEQIFCVLSSPWYVSQTRIIHLKKNTPFVFTAKLANDLMRREANLFREESIGRHKDPSDTLRLLEFKNIRTALNGYETARPLGQKTKDLNLTVFASMSAEKVLLKMEDAIHRFFYVKPVEFFSSALSAFAAVRDLHVKNKDFLLIKVGGEVTDILMVKDNALEETLSFPSGRNFFTRGMVFGLACSVHEANSLISILKDKHTEKSLVRKSADLLENLKKEWLAEFEQALSRLATDISIPSRIFLMADAQLGNFFSELIGKEEFNQYTFTEGKFQISLLESSAIVALAQGENREVLEPDLILSLIYINRLSFKK